jgi:hypothetical protein
MKTIKASYLVGAGERAVAVADAREPATDTKTIEASYLVGASERAAAGADTREPATDANGGGS